MARKGREKKSDSTRENERQEGRDEEIDRRRRRVNEGEYVKPVVGGLG